MTLSNNRCMEYMFKLNASKYKSGENVLACRKLVFRLVCNENASAVHAQNSCCGHHRVVLFHPSVLIACTWWWCGREGQ